MELESFKANNDQLEQTVVNLQRKINLCNKEITDLNKELSAVQKQRDLTIENCARRDEMLNEIVRITVSRELSFIFFTITEENREYSILNFSFQPKFSLDMN